MKENAIHLFNLDYTVIPINEDKSPMVAYGGYTNGQTADDVERIFDRPAHGVGILACRGLEIIDIDVKNYDGGLNLLTELFDIAGYAWSEIDSELSIVKFPIVKTRSGGWHIYFRSSYAVGNQKFAFNKERRAIFESRGVGGYVVAPPTPGYEWYSREYSFHGIPFLSHTEREILLDACRSFNEFVETYTPPPQSQQSNQLPSRGLRPGDDYNERVSDHEITSLLERNGWRVCRQNAERIYYTRPGKTKGVSGDYNKRLKLFKSWSSSVGNLPTEKSVTPFVLYALIEHHSDFNAAARALSEKGYGEQLGRQAPNNYATPQTTPDAPTPTTKKSKIKWYVPGEDIKPQKFTVNQVSQHGSLPIVGPGMICGIAGPQKSRKSLLLHALIAGGLSGNPYLGISVDLDGQEILHVDCEQPEYWWRRDISRIEKMAGGHNTAYKSCNMRGMTPPERREEFHNICMSMKPGIIVLDGLVDLCDNFNDIPASQKTMDLIMEITGATGALLFAVLHTTKSDGFVRGHLGSFLQQKSDYVIQVNPMEDNTYSQAKALDSRGKPMWPICFVQGENDLPVLHNFMTTKKADDWA